MLTVHHLENSRSHRILWLLEELEADYEIKRYERDPDTSLAPKALRDIHPLGKAPVITHEGRTVAESGAIVEYILDEFGPAGLRPERGTDAFLEYRYWLHYAEGSAMAKLLLKFIFGRLPDEAPLVAKPVMSLIDWGISREFIDPELNQHVSFWSDELAERDYFAGDTFTAADIQMSMPLQFALGLDVGGDHPRLNRYLTRLEERPAYQRAVEKGGGLSMDF